MSEHQNVKVFTLICRVEPLNTLKSTFLQHITVTFYLKV